MLDEIFRNYEFIHPEAHFIRHNENMTYMVKDDNHRYLLKIHQTIDGLDLSRGSRNVDRQNLITSEIALLNKLHTNGDIKVQLPVKNTSGNYVTYLENGIPVTVLSWLEGEDLQKAVITDELAYEIGETIGKIHTAMSKTPCTNRYCYNEVYVDEVSNDINEAFRLNHITEHHYMLIQNVLSFIRRILKEERQHFIFIHADLSKSNLINSNCEICPIDFSLSGYGLAEQDLSDINWTLHNDKLTPSLLAGYKSVTKHMINHAHIHMFTALYPIGYIASHHKKIYQDENYIQRIDRWCDIVLTPFIISLPNRRFQ